MEEQKINSETPVVDYPNNDISLAYKFFLYNYLHPYDIAVELFDFPDVITDPFNDYQFKNAFKDNLITEKQFGVYAVIYILNHKFREFARSRSIKQTDAKTSIQHYLVEDNVLSSSDESFIQDLREFSSIDITKYLCAYLLNINLSQQAYEDENFLASNIIYHIALDNLVQLKLLLGKNLMLDTNRVYKNIAIKNGSKGGEQKSKNNLPLKQQLLDYYKQFYDTRNEVGSYLYSATQAAEKILERIGTPDGNGDYKEFKIRSLAKNINNLRKPTKAT